jgi:LAO/AO transport system kinase
MTEGASPRRRELTVDEYVEGVLAGDRTTLARAITLVESSAPEHAEAAQAVLAGVLPHAGDSLRVGITGVPGVGKSTFIETLGVRLCDRGHRLAVLAVDPSSSVSRGSILGDKTRMELLSRREEAFIRPSPAAGTLGGVTRKSRETILLCEAAGFDIVFVETVGVGQSETVVRSMVDVFLLLMLSGAGDELQGIKKGVIELADLIAVNKADGDNVTAAERARAEYQQALHYLAPATEGWTTRALTCSAITGDGIDELWETIREFEATTRESGVFQRRRRRQTLDWVHAMIEERLLGRFLAHPGVAAIRAEVEAAVVDGTLPPVGAVDRLLGVFDGSAG